MSAPRIPARPRRAARRVPLAAMTLAAALGAAAGAAPALAAAPAFAPPQPQVQTLENGLRVAVFEDARLPIVQVQLYVPAGVASEPGDRPGLAHLTGQMLRRGTSARDAARFAAEMSGLGSALTVSVLRDYAVAGAGFLAEDLPAGLTLVADAVTRPLFPNEEIGRVRFEITRALIELHLNPVTTAEEQIWPAALPEHPYGRPPAGTVAAIAERDREELKAFHASRYLPGGSVLVVAGDVEADAVFALARDTFGAWSGRVASTPSIMVGPGSLQPRVRIIDLPTGARTELRIVTGAPERGSLENAPFTLAARVLGDIPESRLGRRARWPGLIGPPGSAYSAMRDAGLLVVRASALTDSAGAAVAALREALGALAGSPPDAAEVEAAKSLERTTWPMALSTLAGLAGAWGDADWYGLGAEALRGHAGALDTLEAVDIGRTAARWIDPERLVILAVGPADVLRPQLEPFGAVEVVRIDDSPQAAWATREPTAEDLERGRRIVEQGVEAAGGLDALRNMKDSSIDATVTINAQGRDVTGRLRQARKEPFRFREIMSVFVYESEQVLVDDHGWVYETQQGGVKQADSLQIEMMRSNFLSDVPHQLMLASEPGAVAIHRGEETVDGRRAEVVEVRLESEERLLWLLFDAATHELVASDVRGGIPPRILARRVFGDYRRVKDMRLPHAETRYVQGTRVMDIRVDEMGYNIGVGDEMFRPPIDRE